MTKQEFDNIYVGKKIVVWCPTEELANEFLRKANEFGYMWCDGERYIDFNAYRECGQETCYCIDRGEYSPKDFYESEGMIVVEFKGFNNSKKLIDIDFSENGKTFIDNNNNIQWRIIDGDLLGDHSDHSDNILNIKKYYNLKELFEVELTEVKKEVLSLELTVEELEMVKKYLSTNKREYGSNVDRLVVLSKISGLMEV